MQDVVQGSLGAFLGLSREGVRVLVERGLLLAEQQGC